MITKPYHPTLLHQKRNGSKRVTLPAVWMRCGTSKGLFIERDHLPSSHSDWSPWLIAAMGSKGDDAKQLDGIGGATSTTSKVAVVARSSRPNIDVEYTFAQVAVGKETVDFSGNCGNIASGVGPYAVEQGLVQCLPGQKQIDIRILNTNTNSILVETIQLDEDGYYEESGDYRIAGISGSGSEVKVSFVDPAGTMTDRLFPSGLTSDVIDLPSEGCAVQATMIDSGNPFVLVNAESLPVRLAKHMLDEPSKLPIELFETIRCHAAVQMGLAVDLQQASKTRGTPKIALMLRPKEASDLFGRDVVAQGADVAVVSMSMGKMHPTLQLTGAVAIASALSVDGTTASGASSQIRSPATVQDESATGLESCRTVCIAHHRGSIVVEVKSRQTAGAVSIQSCGISRTARTLFEGQVRFNL